MSCTINKQRCQGRLRPTNELKNGSLQVRAESAKRAHEEASAQLERQQKEREMLEEEHRRALKANALAAEHQRRLRAEMDRRLMDSMRRAADEAATLAEARRRPAQPGAPPNRDELKQQAERDESNDGELVSACR